MKSENLYKRLTAILVAAFFLCLICVTTNADAAYQPDFYSVTATAAYRPVDRPGTQRRVAQTDAEEKARKQIYEYVGSFRYVDGRTINDILNQDARLKAKVLEIIRNSETYDWAVNSGCACVQVWVRLDINKVRAAMGECGY
jgi:hypothetical protein